MIEIVAVVVGALLGYGTGWFQQSRDRAQRRIGLATAMLLELRRAERNLREIAMSEHAALARVRLPLDAHRQALGELLLFSPSTAAALFDFLSMITDLELGQSLLETGQLKPSENSKWLHQCRAAYAANRVDALKAALLSEGGRVQPERDIERELRTFPNPPQLEPPSFPQPKVD
jgi:hypothetical protein